MTERQQQVAPCFVFEADATNRQATDREGGGKAETGREAAISSGQAGKQTYEASPRKKMLLNNGNGHHTQQTTLRSLDKGNYAQEKEQQPVVATAVEKRRVVLPTRRSMPNSETTVPSLYVAPDSRPHMYLPPGSPLSTLRPNIYSTPQYESVRTLPPTQCSTRLQSPSVRTREDIRQQASSKHSEGDSPASLKKMFLNKNIDLSESVKLGAGRYSKVVTAKNAQGEQIAMKIINTQKVTEEFRERFLPREIYCWKLMSHDNLVRILGHYQSANHVFLTMELGEVDVLRYVQANGPVPEATAKQWMHGVICGVAYMHSLKIAHRDLKLENLILVKGRVKIGDFGFCKQVESETLSQTFCGSKSYSSPEILLGRPYDPFKADVWSLGVITFIVCTDHMPFIENQPNHAIVESQKLRAYRFPRTLGLSLECINVVHYMLTYSPRDRPSAVQCLETKWLQRSTLSNSPAVPNSCDHCPTGTSLRAYA